MANTDTTTEDTEEIPTTVKLSRPMWEALRARAKAEERTLKAVLTRMLRKELGMEESADDD